MKSARIQSVSLLIPFKTEAKTQLPESVVASVPTHSVSKLLRAYKLMIHMSIAFILLHHDFPHHD